MKVVFFDKQKETYRSIDGMTQLDSIMSKVGGRYVRLWLVTTNDGKRLTFKQKYFEIHRIET